MDCLLIVYMNFLNVPKISFIIDPRTPHTLKSLTLSGFRKNDVQKALEKAILQNNLETALQMDY